MEALILVPSLQKLYGCPVDFAVCPVLKKVVTCDFRDQCLKVSAMPSLSVFAVGSCDLLTHLYGFDFEPSVSFEFSFRGRSRSALEFLKDGSSRLVVVCVSGAVFVLDLVRMRVTGTILHASDNTCLNGLATHGSLVALSVAPFPFHDICLHDIRLFKEQAGMWSVCQVVAYDVQFHGQPGRLAFTADGTAVIMSMMMNSANFYYIDRTDVAHLFCNERVHVLAELAHGWLVKFDAGMMQPCIGYIYKHDPSCIRWLCAGRGCAWVPNLGLLVLQDSRLQVLAIPDELRMARMSSARTGWLSAVYKSINKHCS